MNKKALAFLGGVGVGALVMYFLDPRSGDARRARAGQRLASAGRKSGEALGDGARDLVDRAGTLARRTRGRLRGEPADDVVAQGVRSALDSIIAHPGRVRVSADNGVVTLSGVIDEEEAKGLTAAARAVRGVKDVVDRTEIREEVSR